VRKRRGIDLAALLRAGLAGKCGSSSYNQKNENTLDHTAKMRRAAAGIKPAWLHFLAFIARTNNRHRPA
jgi:hypothetical protein